MSSPTPRFGIAINRGVDHVEVTFTPQHGAPSGVVWYVATLVDGIAMSGDGFDYGDVTEAITTVFYVLRLRSGRRLVDHDSEPARSRSRDDCRRVPHLER